MGKLCLAIVATLSGPLAVIASTASGDTIVNVDARFNAPPTVSGSLGLVEQFLTVGDYTFTLVNNVNGHSSFHVQANQTGWSFHTPGSNWSTNYNFAYDDNDPTNDTLGSEYTGPDRNGGGRFVGAASALEAFDQTVATNSTSVTFTSRLIKWLVSISQTMRSATTRVAFPSRLTPSPYLSPPQSACSVHSESDCVLFAADGGVRCVFICNAPTSVPVAPGR